MVHSIAMAVASLLVLLCEYAMTLGREVTHIWRRPFTGVRVVYVFSRYFAIIVQSINTYLVFKPLSAMDLSTSTCIKWFSFQMITSCLLMCILDGVIMLRVYALYNKDNRVGAILLLLFWGQTVVQMVTGHRAVSDGPYNGICDAAKTHPLIIYFGVSVCATHLLLGILTAFKYDLVRIGAPVARLVTRDGAIVLVTICAIFVTIVPYSFISQVTKGHIVFGWPATIISICCCRMIMNLQTLRVDGMDISRSSATPELSTVHFDVHGGEP